MLKKNSHLACKLYVFFARQLLSPRYRNWPNSYINVSLMWARVRVIFTEPKQFYLHRKVFKKSAQMCFFATRFLQETVRIGQKSPLVKWSALL